MKANPKANLFLIFVGAQCEHQIKFSVNPSGSDVAFTFEMTQIKAIVFTEYKFCLISLLLIYENTM